MQANGFTYKIRIVELSESFGLGGSEQAIEIRTELISKDLFDPLVIAFDTGGPRLEELKNQKIRTIICNEDINLLERSIRHFSPHILSFYRGKSYSRLIKAVTEIATRINVPIVVETNHFGRKSIENLTRVPDMNIHVSLSSFYKYFRQIDSPLPISLSKNKVIYNPIPSSKFSKYYINSIQRNLLRKRYGIDENQFVACRISRPDLRKWSSILEAALPFILTFNPSLKIIFMAAPPIKEKILKRKFGERVIFLPPTPSVQTLSEVYQISDFMLHSSGIGESFGLSIAEGMYWNLPVIVDSTPNLDNAQIELVDNNINGIIVNSAMGFASAVQRLIKTDGLLKKMGENAKYKAIDKFSDILITKQWEKIYIEALSRKIKLSEDLLTYSSKIEKKPAENEYLAFENEYKERLKNVWHSDDNLIVKLKYKSIKFFDTLSYARQIGGRAVINTLKSRLNLGSLFRRI